MERRVRRRRGVGRCKWQWQWHRGRAQTSRPPHSTGLVINQPDVSVRWFFTPCRRSERRFRKLRRQTTLHLLTGNLIWKYFIKSVSVSLFRVTQSFLTFGPLTSRNGHILFEHRYNLSNCCPSQFKPLKLTIIVPAANQIVIPFKHFTVHNILLA